MDSNDNKFHLDSQLGGSYFLGEKILIHAIPKSRD